MVVSAFAKTSALPWPVTVSAAALLHAALLVLAPGGSTAPGGSGGEIQIQIAAVEGGEIPREEAVSAAVPLPDPAPVPGLAHMVVPFDPLRPEVLLVAGPPLAGSAGGSPELARTALPDDLRSRGVREGSAAAAGENAPGRSGLAGLDDAPLAAEPLGSAQPDSGAAGNPGSAGAAATEGPGSRIGVPRGGEHGGGRGDPFDALNARLRAGETRLEFKLSGQPDFPRACRQGICRGGRACEGVSEWRVTVGPEGGVPQKVEALKKMGCELQNASIRTFFEHYEFNKTGKTEILVFPVEMYLRR
jgi:hypothetical protein